MPQLIGDTREETRSKQRRCTMENRRQPPSDNLPPHCAAYVDIAGEDDETKLRRRRMDEAEQKDEC